LAVVFVFMPSKNPPAAVKVLLEVIVVLNVLGSTLFPNASETAKVMLPAAAFA